MPKSGSPDRVNFSRPCFLPGVELVSVAYRHRIFPVHTHDGYVVGTVIGGAEQLRVGGSTHVVARGEVLQLHPYEPHANCALGSEMMRYLVFFWCIHRPTLSSTTAANSDDNPSVNSRPAPLMEIA
jgi:hypothetical protein